MKALDLLEQKIVSLIELVQKLRAENVALAEKNAQLVAHVKGLENSMLASGSRIEEFNQEKVITKKVVDSLIKEIDSLVKSQQ